MSIVRYAKVGARYGFYNELVVTPENASDVYMYEHVDDFIACQECKLGGSQDHDPGKTIPFVKLKDSGEARDHLLAHRAAGHAVPNYAFEFLK